MNQVFVASLANQVKILFSKIEMSFKSKRRNLQADD